MKRKPIYMTGAMAALSIGCVAGLGWTSARAEETSPNSVTLSMGGASVDGDQAAYQKRLGQNGDFYGGLSDVHLEAKSGDVLWSLDGRALFGNHDYDLTLAAEKEGLGYLAAGYKEYRTFYDLTGGYLPTETFIDNTSEAYVDRGEIWTEAGLRIDNLPEVTLRYSHGWRKGMKDSTTWGYTEATDDYHITPSTTQIDEMTDTITLDVADTIGNFDYDLGLTYRRVRNEDTRTTDYMHDVDGSGGIPAGPGGVPALSNVDPEDLTVNDTLAYDSDMFNSHVSFTRRFSEKLLASFGYSNTSMDTNIGGQREGRTVVGDNLYTGAAHGVWGLTGGSQAQINVINANLWWNPVENIVVVPSLRMERTDQNAYGWNVESVRNSDVGFDPIVSGGVTTIPATGADPDDVVDDAVGGTWPGVGADRGRLEERRNISSNEWQELTESLEVRYDGVENVLFFGSTEFTQSSGDYFHSTYGDRHNGNATTLISREFDSNLEVQKYTVGANWYALSNLSFSAQTYYRAYDQEFSNSFVGGEDGQIKEHMNETLDLNLRMTWRAMSNLSFITRYDYQQTEIENLGMNNTVPYALVETAEIDRHIISQTVSWVPAPDLMLQAMVSYVKSETDTGADESVPASISDSENDYMFATLSASYALNKRTNVSAVYSYYYSDNYTLPSKGVGYDSSLEEHMIGVNLSRVLTSNMILKLGYGYYVSDDGIAGGNNDFDAHMFSSGLQVRF